MAIGLTGYKTPPLPPLPFSYSSFYFVLLVILTTNLSKHYGEFYTVQSSHISYQHHAMNLSHGLSNLVISSSI